MIITREEARAIVQRLVSSKLMMDEAWEEAEEEFPISTDGKLGESMFDLLEVAASVADILVDPGNTIDKGGAVTWYLFQDGCGSEGLLTPPDKDINPDAIDSVDTLLDAIGYD